MLKDTCTLLACCLAAVLMFCTVAACDDGGADDGNGGNDAQDLASAEDVALGDGIRSLADSLEGADLSGGGDDMQGPQDNGGGEPGVSSGHFSGTIGDVDFDVVCNFQGGMWDANTVIAGKLATITCNEDLGGPDSIKFSLSFNYWEQLPAEFDYGKPDVWSGTTQILKMTLEHAHVQGKMFSIGNSNLDSLELAGTWDAATGHMAVEVDAAWGPATEGPAGKTQIDGNLQGEFDVTFKLP